MVTRLSHSINLISFWLLGVLLLVSGARSAEHGTGNIHVDLVKGTIDGVSIQNLTVDILTDMLGPPAYLTDREGKRTRNASEVRYLDFPELGIQVRVGGVEKGEIHAVYFALIGRNPNHVTRKRPRNLFEALERLNQTGDYKPFNGSFTPTVTERTKKKHIDRLFRSALFNKVWDSEDKVFSGKDGFLAEAQQHLTVLRYNPITMFAEVVELYPLSEKELAQLEKEVVELKEKK